MTQIELDWCKLFAAHGTKVLGFDIDDLLNMREYLNVTDQKPEELEKSK